MYSARQNTSVHGVSAVSVETVRSVTVGVYSSICHVRLLFSTRYLRKWFFPVHKDLQYAGNFKTINVINLLSDLF